MQININTDWEWYETQMYLDCFIIAYYIQI